MPFSPETPASGIGFTAFFRACWYRLSFEAPTFNPGDRLLLHFAAVDYRAMVWVNGHSAAEHEGGYTPFTVDITGFLKSGTQQTLVVCAEDYPAKCTGGSRSQTATTWFAAASTTV